MSTDDTLEAENAALRKEIGTLRRLLVVAYEKIRRADTGEWWHNPERDSQYHYSLEGRVALCQREFNSEWERGDDPANRCRTCHNIATHLTHVLAVKMLVPKIEV